METPLFCVVIISSIIIAAVGEWCLRTLEDEVWVYFGSPSDYWQDKCTKCRGKLLGQKVPVYEVHECINCWKIEVWRQSPWFQKAIDSLGVAKSSSADFHGESISSDFFELYDFGGSLHFFSKGPDYLFGLACKLAIQSDGNFVAKLSKYPIQVVPSGEPPNQYPDILADRLLMVYASSIRERNELRLAICGVLAINPLLAEIIPVRRGCWLYDDILGPWQKWYATDKDF